MFTKIETVSVTICLAHLIGSVFAIPQQPEINDQFDNSNQTVQPNTITHVTYTKKTTRIPNNITVEENEIIHTGNVEKYPSSTTRRYEVKLTEDFITKLYNMITGSIKRLLSAPKINSVLKNVGTCVVNGVMELVSFYLPAPVIPLIASAAGMIIPFEPVVMLREKMPVASYRRAFQTAMNGFLSTFDRFKDNYQDDPYMTRRFNRRFMNDDSSERRKKI